MLGQLCFRGPSVDALLLKGYVISFVCDCRVH